MLKIFIVMFTLLIGFICTLITNNWLNGFIVTYILLAAAIFVNFKYIIVLLPFGAKNVRTNLPYDNKIWYSLPSRYNYEWEEYSTIEVEQLKPNTGIRYSLYRYGCILIIKEN